MYAAVLPAATAKAAHMANTDRRPATLGPRRRHGRERGYAFLYTLMLVALLGVSLLVVTDVASMSARREREQNLLQIGHEFREALARYQARSASAPGAQYPMKLEELVEDRRGPQVAHHLRRLYVDPITLKPDWGLVKHAGRIVGVYSLALGAPIKQGDFDVEDTSFTGASRYRDWIFVHPSDRPLAPPGTPPPGAPATGGGDDDGTPDAIEALPPLPKPPGGSLAPPRSTQF